jgi:DeoR C terminal sensor domain/DeoR-like helix-turn-helix domain
VLLPVRRDLRELDKAGLLQRVHGGALPRSPTSIHDAEREKESTDAKREIGAAAARLLRPGEVVVLDGGTMPLAVAEHLPADLALTIVTPSLPALEVLSGQAKAECVVVGRRFKEYRYRDSMFPTSRFRMAYDFLKDQRPGRVVKDYLAVLHPATPEGESRVDEALRLLLDQGRPPDAESVTETLRQGQRPSAVTDVLIVDVDLQRVTLA